MIPVIFRALLHFLIACNQFSKRTVITVMNSESDKKRKNKATKPEKKKRPPEQEESTEQDAAKQDEDFGGIPMRDLRKNLGCGG